MVLMKLEVVCLVLWKRNSVRLLYNNGIFDDVTLKGFEFQFGGVRMVD